METQVVQVIRRQLCANNRTLDASTHLVGDLGADSLALLELTLVFEETFGIEIPDEEAEKIRTVRDVCRLRSDLSAALGRGGGR